MLSGFFTLQLFMSEVIMRNANWGVTMHYDDMHYEDKIRLERAEAQQKKLQWDEYYCFVTVFLALIPVISMSLSSSGIEPFMKWGAVLHRSISIHQLLYSWILGTVHFFRLILRLEQDNSKGAMFSVIALFFLIFFRYISNFS